MGDMSVIEAIEFVESLELSEKEHIIADRIIKEIKARLGFLKNVGLQYLSLSRGAATLSGGESFLASLALALGLADVVQACAGGVRLDTMFIDEGFGTLDSETLDVALKALFELQKSGRLIGIISHVEELRSRIPARLEVTKTKSGGSTAHFELGTAES